MPLYGICLGALGEYRTGAVDRGRSCQLGVQIVNTKCEQENFCSLIFIRLGFNAYWPEWLICCTGLSSHTHCACDTRIRPVSHAHVKQSHAFYVCTVQGHISCPGCMTVVVRIVPGFCNKYSVRANLLCVLIKHGCTILHGRE